MFFHFLLVVASDGGIKLARISPRSFKTKAWQRTLLDKRIVSSMPTEQSCLSEHNTCASSRKNAKDKSNSTTLLAIRDMKDTDNSSARGSCSSEKDSGYSDGSEWQQTDVEDKQSNKSQSRANNHTETSEPGQNHELGQRNPGNSTLIPAGRDHPPSYIIKDIVIKQQSDKRGQLLWRNGVRESDRSGSPHLILLQQPSLLPATLHLHKPLSRKSNLIGKAVNGTYLPILNSYPRIAPHPSKKPTEKSSPNHESQNLTKRVYTGHKGDDTHVTIPPEQHLHKLPKLTVPRSSTTGDSLSSSSPTTASTNQASPSVSTSDTTSVLTTRALHRNATTGTRHRRFHNTAEILKQSGLLDITLRTKALLRQSKSTEQDIAQLRQHTELLCQAANNPSQNLNGSLALEHLHRAMAESSSYPNLKIMRSLYIPSTSDTNKTQAAECSEVLPSFLVTTVPNCAAPHQALSEQGRKLDAGDRSSAKVTFMPPDSSTG
ncbi:CLOCK-interacting pacemaker isoform X1 [Brachyistius frenatus]|uniref:CLOCK-interacting pacemaker isoform X1 n=2 Tax=Brachyistius frenatus TaxID=100188 RepID=UPI0037E91AEC